MICVRTAEERRTVIKSPPEGNEGTEYNYERRQRVQLGGKVWREERLRNVRLVFHKARGTHRRRGLFTIRSTNYHRPATKMVSSDELSIVNTSVRAGERASPRSPAEFALTWAQKLPGMERGRGKWERGEDRSAASRVLCACYARICTHSGASRDTIMCRPVKCGFGRL